MEYIKFNKCKSIIDYGCGKAIAYKENFKDMDPKQKYLTLINHYING